MIHRLVLFASSALLASCAQLNPMTWFATSVPAQIQQASAMKFETCIGCTSPTPKTLARFDAQAAAPKVLMPSVTVIPPTSANVIKPTLPKDAVIQVPVLKLKFESVLSRDIRFVWGSSQLGPSAKYILTELAHQYKSEQSVHVQGAVDSTGDPLINEKLAQARAQSTANYLVVKKIPSQRITVTATTSEFVAENTTSEGQARNRRVTVKLMSPSTQP